MVIARPTVLYHVVLHGCVVSVSHRPVQFTAVQHSMMYHMTLHRHYTQHSLCPSHVPQHQNISTAGHHMRGASCVWKLAGKARSWHTSCERVPLKTPNTASADLNSQSIKQITLFQSITMAGDHGGGLWQQPLPRIRAAQGPGGVWACEGSALTTRTTCGRDGRWVVGSYFALYTSYFILCLC